MTWYISACVDLMHPILWWHGTFILWWFGTS